MDFDTGAAVLFFAWFAGFVLGYQYKQITDAIHAA